MQTTQRNNHFPCPGAWNPASPNVSRNAFRSSTAHRGSLLINRRATRLDCSARAGPWPKTPLRHVTLMGFSHLVAVRSSYLLWNNANSSRLIFFGFLDVKKYSTRISNINLRNSYRFPVFCSKIARVSAKIGGNSRPGCKHQSRVDHLPASSQA